MRYPLNFPEKDLFFKAIYNLSRVIVCFGIFDYAGRTKLDFVDSSSKRISIVDDKIK